MGMLRRPAGVPAMTPKKGASLLIPVNSADAEGNTAQAEDVMLAVDRRIVGNTNVLSGFAHRHRDSGDGGALADINENASEATRDRDGDGAGKRAMSDVCEYFLGRAGSCEGENIKPKIKRKQRGTRGHGTEQRPAAGAWE